MRILTVSNLYPRPDQPTRGMFNAQLFREMHGLLQSRQDRESGLENICLVPEWRSWRWAEIRNWKNPGKTSHDTTYVPVFYVPLVGRNMSATFYRKGLSCMREQVHQADALYASWLHPDGTALAALAREATKPVWLMALGTDVSHLECRRRRHAIRQAATDCSGLICVCKPLADRLENAGIPRKKIHVVPNGVDNTRFFFREKIPSRDALQAISEQGEPDTTTKLFSALGEGHKLILFVGNLVDVKAPDVLLRAFSSIDARDAGCEKLHLAMIGTGALKQMLIRLAEDLNVSDRTHFIGTVPHERLPLWMTSADCLALSSRSEGMPNVVLEALASGLPLVCTDVGACREMTADVPGARLVLSGNPGAMAKAITELLCDSIDRKAMADHHGTYTWHHQADRILEIIQS